MTVLMALPTQILINSNGELRMSSSFLPVRYTHHLRCDAINRELQAAKPTGRRLRCALDAAVPFEVPLNSKCESSIRGSAVAPNLLDKAWAGRAIVADLQITENQKLNRPAAPSL